jgi:hypothetical protein
MMRCQRSLWHMQMRRRPLLSRRCVIASSSSTTPTLQRAILNAVLPPCHQLRCFMASSRPSEPIDANKKTSAKTEKRLSNIKDDGLTLSYFISKSTAGTVSSSEHTAHEQSGNINNDRCNTSSPIPMAANLGDEFDDDEHWIDWDIK